MSNPLLFVIDIIISILSVLVLLSSIIVPVPKTSTEDVYMLLHLAHDEGVANYK